MIPCFFFGKSLRNGRGSQRSQFNDVHVGPCRRVKGALPFLTPQLSRGFISRLGAIIAPGSISDDSVYTMALWQRGTVRGKENLARQPLGSGQPACNLTTPKGSKRRPLTAVQPLDASLTNRTPARTHKARTRAHTSFICVASHGYTFVRTDPACQQTLGLHARPRRGRDWMLSTSHWRVRHPHE